MRHVCRLVLVFLCLIFQLVMVLSLLLLLLSKYPIRMHVFNQSLQSDTDIKRKKNYGQFAAFENRDGERTFTIKHCLF